MPNDPFPDGRTEIRGIIKEQPHLFHLAKKPVPWSDWGQFKYIHYLDGVGPSQRLPYLLDIGSVVFLPDMVIPSWPMAFIKPWTHYVPI